MATRSVNNGSEVINQMFYIPDGVDELTYDDDNALDADFIDDSEETHEDIELYSEELNPNSDYESIGDNPATPDVYSIVSQTIRTAATGNQVIDVVIEVEDIEAAQDYEVRVTKV